MVLGSGAAGLIYISIQNGFDFTTIRTLVMALAYVWGLALAIYLMGHGLVAIPRKLLRNANYGQKLRRLYSCAPRVFDQLTDATGGLQDLELQLSKLEKRKNGLSPSLQVWVEELADQGGDLEQGSSLPEGTELRTKIPAVITERYLADVTRRLHRARHQHARYAIVWGRLVQEAADTQAIVDSAASRRLEFTKRSAISSVQPYSILSPYMRYVLHVHILRISRIVLATLFSIASISIVWTEVIKSFAPGLSIVSLTIVGTSPKIHAIGFFSQVIASLWISYMCAAALAAISDAKVWRNRALVPRNTYGESACWYAGQVARLTVPLSYNFLTFLPRNVQHKTTFYAFLGRFIDLTPLGKGIDYVFPMFILLPVFASIFNIYGKIRKLLCFGIIEEDDEPEDADTVSWREGRELVEREISGPGSLGLGLAIRPPVYSLPSLPSSRRSTGVDRLPAGSRSPFSAQNHRRSASATPLLESNEGDENALVAFAHRIGNTLTTASPPRFLQDSPLFTRRPRWMGGNGNDEAESSRQEEPNMLRRLFGGGQTFRSRLQL